MKSGEAIAKFFVHTCMINSIGKSLGLGGLHFSIFLFFVYSFYVYECVSLYCAVLHYIIPNEIILLLGD